MARNRIVSRERRAFITLSTMSSAYMRDTDGQIFAISVLVNIGTSARCRDGPRVLFTIWPICGNVFPSAAVPANTPPCTGRGARTIGISIPGGRSNTEAGDPGAGT
jgi:hypothetical protein